MLFTVFTWIIIHHLNFFFLLPLMLWVSNLLGMLEIFPPLLVFPQLKEKLLQWQFIDCLPKLSLDKNISITWRWDCFVSLDQTNWSNQYLHNIFNIYERLFGIIYEPIRAFLWLERRRIKYSYYLTFLLNKIW